ARDVGVAVVPGDEVRRTEGARQSDAGDRQLRIADRAGGEDHRVVEPTQVVQGQVGAVVDVAQQPDVTAVEDLVQGDDDLLDPRVVRGDAVAHQPEGCGQPLEQVDRHLRACLGEDVGR